MHPLGLVAVSLPSSPWGAPLCVSLGGFCVAPLILLSSSCSPPCGQEHPKSEGFVIPHSPVFPQQKWRSPGTPWILWENVKETRGQLS